MQSEGNVRVMINNCEFVIILVKNNNYNKSKFTEKFKAILERLKAYLSCSLSVLVIYIRQALHPEP